MGGETRQEGETWFVERAGRKNQCKCNSGNVFCVVESDSVTAPEIPSIRVTGEEEETGSKINFPEERRAAAGVRSSRRGSEALLRIVEEASQASQCSQAGGTRSCHRAAQPSQDHKEWRLLARLPLGRWRRSE